MSVSRIRRAAVVLAVAALALGAASAVSAASPPVPEPGAAASLHKVAPALLAKLGSSGQAATVIEFSDTADLSAAARTKDWTRRGQAVVDALQATARRSQAAVVDQLKKDGVHYRSFWIDNTVYVENGTARLARSAAADAHVKAVRAAQTAPLEKPTAGHVVKAASGVEWGVADIKADQVWDTLGDRGEGVVVANIDSGVQFDHPALVASYRGNRGDGSFDHDYNWWDPSHICPTPAPCDNNGHGSHTMGTMVGDGGEGNRIGVAPGARWIAAKGCESGGCSELALTSSAQWVLAPTDLAGLHPDVSKRPNIVNSSWGDDHGGNDWYRDFVRAWVASGMFPAFANGNAGPACGTSGSPGDYPESYSVGNYAAGGTIDPSSSRGGGASGRAKPDISAPGTNVRSSVPGGRYVPFTGTSMASPHVAATVALMWSRSPALVGDIDATRQLLDDTARNKADAQCGGTADDNNVYGEGELDALAAVSAVPTGNVGTLTGTVTDADTGQPISSALVSLTGPANRNVVTREDGGYSIALTEGSYHLSAALFGYRTQALDVVITGGTSTIRDVGLTNAPLVRLRGHVRDGSGHGWPLYAKVVVENTPVSTYTDPATGHYSMQVPAGASYTVDVDSQYPGYVAQSHSVAVDGDSVHDYDLAIDAATCTAPGYRRGAGGLHQSFDGTTAPPRWTIVDHGGNGQVWRFDGPGRQGNRTGGTGRYAVLDSYAYGRAGLQNASLVSPPTNLSAVADPVLEFRTDFKDYYFDRAAVDVSVDSGTTWTNVWRPRSDFQGQVRLPLPMAAHRSSVQVRFHFGPVGYGWWWQVDDVYLGGSGCEKAPGGLLFGRTTSSVTGRGLGGVTLSAATGTHVTSASDGFYSLFAAATDRYTASLESYTDTTAKVRVHSNAATRHDFALGSGRLTVPRTVTAKVGLGGKATVEIALANTGDRPATYGLTEREPDGQVAGPTDSPATADAPVQHVPVHADPMPGRSATPAAVPLGNPSGGEWVQLPNYPHAVFDSVAGVYRGRLYSFTGAPATGASYRYDPATSTWSPLADSPVVRESGFGGYVGAGRFVITGGVDPGGAPAAATSIYDADTDTWSSAAPIPTPVSGAGHAVLDGKLYVVGGCTTTCGSSTVLRYDPAIDRWTKLADFPYAVARSACGGIGARVYCAGGYGPDADGLATWAYTPATNTWQRVADLPQDMWGGGSAVVGDELVISGGVINHGSMKTNEGYAYDPVLDRWRSLPNRAIALFQTVGACGFFDVGGGDGEQFFYPIVEQLPGFGDCAAPKNYPWLSLRGSTGTVQPGRRTVVDVTLDASRVSRPGTYLATLRVGDRTPFPVRPITVRLVVTPRR